MNQPLCFLCLFKIENTENDIEKTDNSFKLREILVDLFAEKINLTENNLHCVCINCLDKLTAFHEYYLFVLANQVKHNTQKILEEHNNSNNKDSSVGPEFVSVVKVEVDVKNDENIENESIGSANGEYGSRKNSKKVKKKVNRRKDTRKRIRPRKTTPEQQAHKEMVYQKIFEFYEMTCDICNKDFSSYFNVIRHYRKIHDKIKGWNCCNLKLNSTTRLYEHLLNHKNPNTCVYCEQQFVERTAFKKHKCSKLQYVICNECGKQFQRKGKLREHLKIHFPEYIFCELCGKSFTKKHKFREHMDFDHGNIPQFQPCPICGVVISSRNYGMKDHIREKHKKQVLGPSKCDQCNKEYANDKNLKRHIREEHTFGRKHQCQQCNKRFLNLKTLKEHESIHTGNPNYICEFCSAPFKSNGNYYAHKRRLHPVEYAEQKANRNPKNVITKSENIV